MKLPLYCVAVAFLLTGCSGDGEDEHSSPDKPPHYMLYSPNGEPLNGGPLGTPTCAKAEGGWFDRMNTAGSISENAFIRDAKMQFARMDIDHNGYIVSEELDRFRAPYRQQPEAAKDSGKEKSEKGRGKHKGKNQPGRSDPSLSMSDPVMSADTNLDFKVTPEEFTRQAHDVFAKLDTNHDGMLTRAEALDWCDQKKPGDKD